MTVAMANILIAFDMTVLLLVDVIDCQSEVSRRGARAKHTPIAAKLHKQREGSHNKHARILCSDLITNLRR